VCQKFTGGREIIRDTLRKMFGDDELLAIQLMIAKFL
jgi:hypothetical protein